MNGSLLRGLTYIVGAADCGNVTEAARRLNVSQPSISSAIAQFESEFGVQLFVRQHSRGITLTAAGERVVRDARALLAHAQDFSASVRALGESTAGEITVGAFPTLALRFMPGLLASLAEAHPGLVVHLEEGDQDEIVAGLQSGRLEAALSYGYALPEDIETVTLALLRPHAILPKTHAAAGRPMVTLAELSEEPFLLLDLPHSREYFLRLFAQEGVRPRITHRSRSSELLRGLVGRGRGFTLHNATPATPATYDGTEVAMVPLSGEREPTEVMLLVSRRVHRRAAVDAFLGHVREAFAALSLRA